MASVYQRTNKDGSKVWRVVVRVKGHPTVCEHHERKQVAYDRAAEIELQIKQGKFISNKAKDKTLNELITLYIDDAVIGHHKAAKDTIQQLNYFRERLGKYALIFITPELLIEERKKLLALPTYRGTTRKPATVNRYFATLSGAFRYACKNLRWVEDNPCAILLKLKAKPKSRRILVPGEDIRLLQACRQSQSPYLYCIVLMGLTTGARKSEILKLCWEDIDFDNRIAHIKDSKNGKSRRIGLVNSVMQELKKIYESRDPKKKLVFASKTAFGRVDIKKAWQPALKKAGIENFVFHGLRHHYCSMGGQMGASSVQLRAQLGHSSSQMTDHYSHIEADSTRYIGERIEQEILEAVTND